MPNPWLERRVLLVAHQGGAKEAPSSTGAAIDHALECGADVLELDVHRSRDGVLIVGHDDTLDRTTERSGAIAELSAAEITACDAAYHFVPELGVVPGLDPGRYVLRGRAASDPSLRPLTLEEVLEDYPRLALNLDLKEGPPQRPGYEAELAAALRAHGRDRDVIVTSFADERVETFRDAAAEIDTAPGTNALTAFVQSVRAGAQPDPSIRRHAAIQMPHRYAGVKLVDERLVDAVHRLGLALHVWTVDDETEMEELIDAGVDGIMTDRPSVLRAVLVERRADWRGEPPFRSD